MQEPRCSPRASLQASLKISWKMFMVKKSTAQLILHWTLANYIQLIYLCLIKCHINRQDSAEHAKLSKPRERRGQASKHPGSVPVAHVLLGGRDCLRDTQVTSRRRGQCQEGHGVLCLVVGWPCGTSTVQRVGQREEHSFIHSFIHSVNVD